MPIQPRVKILDAYVLRHLTRHPARGRRYTVQEFASAVGVHRSYVGTWFNGTQTTISREHAQAVSEALGVPGQCMFAPWLSIDSDDKAPTTAQ